VLRGLPVELSSARRARPFRAWRRGRPRQAYLPVADAGTASSNPARAALAVAAVIGRDGEASRGVEGGRFVVVEAQQEPRFGGRDVEHGDPAMLVDAMAVLTPGERAESSLQLVEQLASRGEASAVADALISALPEQPLLQEPVATNPRPRDRRRSEDRVRCWRRPRDGSRIAAGRLATNDG
jgi:hypothetical protein